ncbi:hypothetical protein [Pseudomonas sp. Leaf58]|uniref:hypothetical protein n=1 Tax=Pseudomonas sp. Leaf58 TaxID=1736226 RepID=UPI0006F51A77|nr:hypothetical protein [Pseudomonas sp. Leaf58]KQN62098.1 hypothetical protein ASF02_07920 [Pseudomonas sp. Leaf58]
MNISTKFPSAAAKYLKGSGFVAELVEKHADALLEFRVVSELELGAPTFRRTKRGEDQLAPVAEVFIKVACAWPPEPQLFGVDLVGRFDGVLIELLDRDQWRNNFHQVPESHRTEALIVHGIRIRAISPSQVDPKDITDSLMRQVVGLYPDIILGRANSNGFSIAPLDILLSACGIRGELLSQIDESCYTEALIDTAIKRSPLALKGLPARFVTAERCLSIAKLHGHLEYVPQSLMTAEMVIAGLSRSSKNDRFVPAELRTEAVYLEAIRNNADVVNALPSELKTLSFYRQAIASNPKTLYELRREAIPEEMIIEAVDRNVTVVRNLSNSQLTPGVVEFVVEKRPEALMLLPAEKRTPELTIKALLGGWAFAALLLKRENCSPELLLDAVRQDYKVLPLLPKELVTEELELEALRQNGALLKLVNADCRTYDRCLAALTQGVDALPFIPDDLLESQAFQRDAARQNGQIHKLWGHVCRDDAGTSLGL